MECVFRVSEDKVEAEFLYNDTAKTESIQNIIKLLNENAKDKFCSLHIAINERDLFIGSSTRSTIDLLVRLKDKKPDEILRVDCSGIYEMRDLLNSENKDESVSYVVLQVRGELKHQAMPSAFCCLFHI